MTSPLLVLNATTCVGRGVVEAAVAAGRPVFAAAGDADGLRALKAAHPRADLTTLDGDAADDGRAEALAASVRALGRPLAAVVVAAFREPSGGRLLEQGSAALRRELDDALLPQFAAARALLPLLADTGRNGTYVVVAGPGGEQPWAGYGQRSVANAASRMLVRVLHDEARALAVRVHLLAVEMPAKTEFNRERACAQWPSTRAIGDRTLALLEQRDGTRADEAVVRYAWHAAPIPALRRESREDDARGDAAHATQAADAPTATTVAALARAIAVPVDEPAPRIAHNRRKTDPGAPTRAAALPVAQRRALDDAWALLQPLLSDHQKN